MAEESDIGMRLDKVLVARFEGKTRQYLQKLFDDGWVKVNGGEAKPSRKLRLKDAVEVVFPPAVELKLEAKDIPLEIVYEDEDVLVINKPAGLVVHPGTHGAHLDDSLVNAILHHCKGKLGGINGTLRPGIVHRLDKDTSGLLVVAKNDMAMQSLTKQFQEKTVKKVYYALLIGHLEPLKGTIEAPIGRSPKDRKLMAVVRDGQGKEAITHYEVEQYYEDSKGNQYTLVRVHLITGRTHQIRVHFSAIGFPLAGDPSYGRAKVNHEFEKNYGLKRQFLNATELDFVLPNGKKMHFETKLPADLTQILEQLEKIVK